MSKYENEKQNRMIFRGNRRKGGFTMAELLMTVAIILMMLDALYKIILELSGAELAGPIGVAQMAGEVAQMGFVPLLNFAAFFAWLS